MVQFWDSITDDLRDWALSQPVFFTASAPLAGRHVNVSPKGLPASTFSIFDPNHAAYVDATGSGSETVAHVYENGRVTVMFCSFAKSPRILRFFCRGTVVEWDDGRFEGLLGRMGVRRVEGARAVVLLEVWKVQTSCGFGVPLLTTTPLLPPSSPSPTSSSSTPARDRTPALSNESSKPVLQDRDTLGHWAHHKVETNTMMDYQREMNAASLDGCPGLRRAVRDGGGRVWVVRARAWVRRVVGGQREALALGMVIGVGLMVVGGWLGLW